MKTLIVGANGFLGSRIASQSIKKGWESWAVYHRKTNNIPEGCQVVKLDEINNVKGRVERVFLSVGSHSLSPKKLIEANCKITELFCQKYKKAKIIFVSSVAVYGSHTGIISKQSSFNNPNDYGLSKILGEKIVAKQPRYSIVRLTYLYGKDMNKNSFLPTIINQALTKKLITLYGDGTRQQDYLHVGDAADLCVRAGLAEKNNIYLGVTGRSLSNLEVAKAIQKLVADCKIKPSGVDRATSWIFKKDKATTKLGWKPKYSFEKGLKEMLSP